MKISRGSLITSVLLFILVVCSIVYFENRCQKNELLNMEQELRLLSHDKQIPFITKYIALVREINEVCNKQLTAYEITEVARIIMTECQIHQDIGLTSDKILGLIERESAFNPDAVSISKAYGLMQLIRTTAEIHLPDMGFERSVSKDVLLDPIINVQLGIRELVRLRKLFLSENVDSWLITLTAYFWGERNAWELLLSKKRARLPSLEYAKGVLENAKQWQGRGIG